MTHVPSDDLRTTLIEAIEAKAADHAIDVVDVEVVGTQKNPTIRVRIDHADADADPISLEEVSAETGWISDLIDQMDPIEGSFVLEVSSPGMARPLRKAADFERFAGNQVSLKLAQTEGRRRYTGTLEGITEGVVRITTDEGAFEFALEDIQSCKIKPDFGDNAKPGHGKSRKQGKR